MIYIELIIIIPILIIAGIGFINYVKKRMV